MTSAAARGRGGAGLGEKDAGLPDPPRLLRGSPTGTGPQASLGQARGRGCRGHRWKGGRESLRGCRCASEKRWTFRKSAGCARSQPQGGRGSRRGQDLHSSPPTGRLCGAWGSGAPKRPFPARLPAPTPGAASPLLTMESSISDLEPRRKAPLPSLAPLPHSSTLPRCCPIPGPRR